MDSLYRGSRNCNLASDLDAADLRCEHSLSNYDDDPLRRSFCWGRRSSHAQGSCAPRCIDNRKWCSYADSKAVKFESYWELVERVLLRRNFATVLFRMLRQNMVREHAGSAAINAEWEVVVVKLSILAAVRARWHYRPLAFAGKYRTGFTTG
jgi:hypothetical protein